MTVRVVHLDEPVNPISSDDVVYKRIVGPCSNALSGEHPTKVVSSDEVLLDCDGSLGLYFLYIDVAIKVVSIVSVHRLHDLSLSNRVRLLDMPLGRLLLRHHVHLLIFSPLVLRLIYSVQFPLLFCIRYKTQLNLL